MRPLWARQTGLTKMFDISLRKALQRREAEARDGAKTPLSAYENEIRFRDRESAMSGMLAGTRVATAVGWQKIEKLRVGGVVLTLDNGLQPLRGITCIALDDSRDDAPTRIMALHVPGGAIGNREDLTLLPRQGVLIESDVAEKALGDPLVLLRAETLGGLSATSRRPMAGERASYVLAFDEDELVFASTGALCICPAGGDVLNRRFAPPTRSPGPYTVLCQETAGDLIAEILWELDVKWAGLVARRRQQTGRVQPRGSSPIC